MTNSKNISRQILRHFWNMSQNERRNLYLTIVFIPLNTFFLSTLLPLYIGKILAGLGQSNHTASHYVPYMIGAAMGGVLANYIAFKAFLSYQPRVMERLETEALDSLLKRGVSFHNNRIAGKLVTDANDYPAAFGQLTNIIFTTIIPIVVSIITGVIVVLLNSVLLGLLVILMTVAIIAYAIWQTMQNTPRREKRHAARRAMIAQQADVITNSVTVKTFAREGEELKEHRRLNHILANHRVRDWSKVAADGTQRIGLLLIFEVAFVLLVIHLVNVNPTLLGIGIFTFSYVLNLTNRLFDIGTIFRGIEDALLDARDMTLIIQSEPEIVDKDQADTLRVDKGKIDFQNVGFQYQDGNSKEKVFHQLNLCVEPGQKIGLVGPSGGGKSTLSRLLLRFEDIQSGSITVDGQNIASVTQTSLRSSIAYVPQEPLLFHRTILENIAYGKPDATLDQVYSASEKAYACDFIETLPEKFNTIVGERGVKLSGGQRQRVAIARAILKDAPILVLDEATSALDSESEVLIQQALWKLMEGRTAIVIAHRLSTIQKMDRIIVLDNGRIVEEGSHKELVGKAGGTYAKLWAHQSGGFIEE